MMIMKDRDDNDNRKVVDGKDNHNKEEENSFLLLLFPLYKLKDGLRRLVIHHNLCSTL